MIIIKDKTKDYVENWTNDSIHVVADFDRTITSSDSSGSWGLLASSNLLDPNYSNERNELFNKYRPIEIDETISDEEKCKSMLEWWKLHVGLFIKYKLSERVIDEAANNIHVMPLRKGAKVFLENMYKKNIPVIIISAGLGNFIDKSLIYNKCYYPNIKIVSNFIEFKDGVAVGISDNITHSLNKNEVSFPEDIKELIKDRENTVLLGDVIPDTKMSSCTDPKHIVRIGFLDENVTERIKYFEEAFDVVCTDNTGYDELMESIPIFK